MDTRNAENDRRHLIRRRDFIVGLSATVAFSPDVAWAQQAMPTIGFLGVAASGEDVNFPPFVQRLRELGWSEGRTVRIESRLAEGRYERLPDLAAELVGQKVDVIVADATASATAAKHVASTIPVVFIVAGDPVGTGLVASLARPGGNVTGLSLQQPEAEGKRLELLRKVVLNLRRVTVLVDAGNPVHSREMPEIATAARSLGLDVAAVEIHQPEDIAPAIAALKGRTDALYILGDPLFGARRADIAVLAASSQLPTISPGRDFVAAGALMSYGPNYADLSRRAAEIVDQVLRGAKPANIPVEQPRKFDLIINRTTAQALGLTVPPTLLAITDEVVE